MVVDNYNRNVFINCPYDSEYISLLRPMIFTLLLLGYNPRIACEDSDSGEPLITRICRLISECRFGIHDISRIQAKKKGEYYRLNMPFELGLDIGCRVFNSIDYSQKRHLILEEKKYRYQAALSDLSNSIIKTHNSDPTKIIRALRNFFINDGHRILKSPTQIWYLFTDFMSDFYFEREQEGFNEEDIYEMPITEYINYINNWLRDKSF